MMRDSLSTAILRTLQAGRRQLSDEALASVAAFVRSQKSRGETFVNRGGKSDLYYTMFGWMLCYALQLSSDKNERKAYLDTFRDTTTLDELHLTVLTVCRLLDRLLSLPHFVPDSVLALLADDTPLRTFFETYQHHGSGGGTNAWAARLVTGSYREALTSAGEKALLTERLLDMQHESGGFLAHEASVMPDMLSTAVATFALKQVQVAPRYDVRPFVEAHWLDDGSFGATLLDEHGDVEYEFYGLLALGSLAN